MNRVGGDGIMAIFGAPLAREDDAVRACYAAMALHAAFERFIGQSDAASARGLALRVGLASSDVVLRSASNDLHQEYDLPRAGRPNGRPSGAGRRRRDHPAVR